MCSRLKEKRIRWEWATIIEEKQKEIEDRAQREKEALLEQVDRSQKLLQRQRSLRWVGRSSATESDMQDLADKWQDLINAASSKANNELNLFKLQTEWAESEAINAAQTALSNSIKVLNEEITGECIAYGSWFYIEEKECLELLEIILKDNKPVRDFSHITNKTKLKGDSKND